MKIIRKIVRLILPASIRSKINTTRHRLKKYIRDEVCAMLRRLNLLPFSKFSRLKKYQNIHKGERCFIVATGPSLTIHDIEKLKNEITFSMNSIPLLFEKTTWRPTYYAMADFGVYKTLSKDERFDLSEINNVFLSPSIDDIIKLAEDKPKYVYDIYPYNDYKASIVRVEDERKYIASPYKIRFSNDIYASIYGFNIAYIVLQIAVYMGFTEIYLLGCDCSYEVGKKLHAVDYEVESSKIDQLRIAASIDNIILAFQSAKEYADAHGIKIYNATRGGNLEVFERVDLDDILEE